MSRSALPCCVVFALLSVALPAQAGVVFEDASNRLSFVRNGSGLGGAAWLDYDADGDLDLFVTNGPGNANGLFQNDGSGSFTDVATAAKVHSGGGHSGVVAGDIDNDGYPDLLLSGDGGVQGQQQTLTLLYRNNRDGTFSDITTTSGITGGLSAFSAAMGDIDNDGFLDIFICSAGSLVTRNQHENLLFRNNGNLTFANISQSSGVNTKLGASAVTMFDYDRDGDTDILVGVCNNVFLAPTPFEMFRNNGDLTFTDVASQVGLTHRGYWMCIAPGDYDGDGDIDIFATNLGTSVFPGWPHRLYRNNGNGTFNDVSTAAGVRTWEFAWGGTFADFDNDTDLDLFFTGSMPVSPFFVSGGPGRLFFNDGAGAFAQVAGTQPVNMTGVFTSGVARADFDHDGFTDIAVVVDTEGGNPGRPILLRNKGNTNTWITLRLHGTRSNRGAIGAFVELTAGGQTQVREVAAGSSVLSSETPWPSFGLGTETTASVRVTWPSGRAEVFANLQAGGIRDLTEGTGAPQATFRRFGVGCAGAGGAPVLDAAAGQLPVVGATFSVDLTNLPAGAPTAMFFGISKTSFGALPLPFPLDPIGLVGCALYVSGEVTVPLATVGSTATLTVFLPAVPQFLGLAFYTQGLVQDGTAVGGATLSNAGEGWTGN